MTLKQCLDKFKKEFKDVSMIEYAIDNIVIPYSECEDEDYYHEEMTILSEDVFTLRCRCGAVHFTIEYCEDTYGATFENLLTGDHVFFQKGKNYKSYDNVEELNQEIFGIVD